MKPLKIYLSGSVKKSFQKEENIVLWSNIETDLVRFLERQNIKADIFNPSHPETQNAFSDIYQAEMDFIASCDMVLVELSQKRGIGVGAEMLHAVNHKVPVYSICPDQGYYRKDDINWLHPFAKNLSTKIFDSLHDLIAFLETSSHLEFK